MEVKKSASKDKSSFVPNNLINEDINTLINENKELQDYNQNLQEKLKKIEYNIKIKNLFDEKFLISNNTYSKEIQKTMDDLRKSNNSKVTKLKSIIMSNTKLSNELDVLQKKVLILPQSKLTAFSNKDKTNLEQKFIDQRRKSGSVVKNNSDIKFISEFFNSTIVYSINQKENELYKNKVLLEKAMILSKILNNS